MATVGASRCPRRTMAAEGMHGDSYANYRFPRIPTKQKRRATGQGAKNPLDPQRPEKTWVPAGASGHELSRPKRVSWLPAYGMISAMSIPVSCAGVKTYVFMDDLVVKFQAIDIVEVI